MSILNWFSKKKPPFNAEEYYLGQHRFDPLGVCVLCGSSKVKAKSSYRGDCKARVTAEPEPATASSLSEAWRLEAALENIGYSSDLKTRAAVISALERSEESILDPLLSVVRRKFGPDRERAIEALGIVGYARAVEPLCERVLGDLARGSLHSQLAQPLDTSPLQGALLDSVRRKLSQMPEIRLAGMRLFPELDEISEAARALRRLSDHRAVEPLMTRLADLKAKAEPGPGADSLEHQEREKITGARRVLIETLGILRDESAFGVTLDALHDADKEVERAAEASLVQFGSLAAEVLTGVVVNATAVDAVAQQRLDRFIRLAARAVDGIDEFEELLRLLEDDKTPEAVRARAAEQLGECHNARAYQPLAVAASSDSTQVRASAIQALGSLRDPRAFDALAAGAEVPHLRRHVFPALGRLGGQPAVELLRRYLEDGDRGTRRLAANALADLRDSCALEPLVKQLKHGPDKQDAALSLGKLGDPRALKALLNALKSSDNGEFKKIWLRQRAAEALGELGDHRAIPALAAALKDTDHNVRLAATGALGALGQTSALDSLRDMVWASRLDHEVEYSARALGKIADRDAVEPLIFRLRGATLSLRKAIWKALGEIGTPALDALRRKIADPRPAVRMVAVEALGQLGDETIGPLLLSATFDGDALVRSTAVRSMRLLEARFGASAKTAPGENGEEAPGAAAAKLAVRLASDDDATFVEALTEAVQYASAGNDLGVKAMEEAMRRRAGRRDLIFHQVALGALTQRDFTTLREAPEVLAGLARERALLGDPRRSQDLMSAALTWHGRETLDNLARQAYAVGGRDQGYAFQLLFNHFDQAIKLAHARGERTWTEQMEEELAAESCRAAAEQGDAEAQYNLALRYAEGRGVGKDNLEAVRWHQKAAEGGNVHSQFTLATLYDVGLGVGQDATQAAKWCQKAADQGHLIAQFTLGVMCEDGRGVPQNSSKAVEWFRKAADQGLASAQHNLGVMYLKGKGVPQDHAEAVVWSRKAADQGHAEAQYVLGLMYLQDTSDQNPGEAARWLRKAAEQGNAEAQVLIGDMCAGGIGVPKDEAEARLWFCKAADQGHADALDRLKNAGEAAPCGGPNG